MLWLAWRELVSRRTATALAAVGLLTATIGFVVLASTSQTTEALLRGDINRAWAAPYDLLVRSPSSKTALERNEGLVRPNFLSDVSGGITDRQLSIIRGIVGVDLAAPIAMVGIYYWPTLVPVDISSMINRDQPLQVFRMTTSATAEAGLTKIPYSYIQYEVVSPTGNLHEARDTKTGYLNRSLVTQGGTIACWSSGNPDNPQCWADHADCSPCYGELPNLWQPRFPGFKLPLTQPMMIAGIDPSAEAAMSGLDHCITNGFYLTSKPLSIEKRRAAIPVLLSTRTFIDERFHLKVDKAVDSNAVLHGQNPSELLNWTSVSSADVTAGDAYARAVTANATSQAGPPSPLLRPGDVAYSQVGQDHLAVAIVPQNLSVFSDPFYSFLPSTVLVPDEARDDWFRPLSASTWNNRAGGNPNFVSASWDQIGTYDPECLNTSRMPTQNNDQIFGLPGVTLPSGAVLPPTRSAAGYVNTPPLLITTLDAARYFADRTQYDGGLGDAYISGIRVKVRGVESPGSISQARLSRVASDIRDATGLEVDIVRGSSPRQIQVDLPAGRFGRPALTVGEQWSVKGVAVRFLRAVTAQNLAVFVVVLLSAAILIGETTYVSVRRRRREFGVLRALGWSSLSVTTLVETEMVVLGATVGVIGTVLSLLAGLLGLRVEVWTLVALAPLSILVAAISASIPALLASRGSAITVISGAGTVRSSALPRSPMALGIRELRNELGGEALFGIAAVALGALLLGMLVLIEVAFRGQLDTSVLGNYLAARVQPFHLVLAGLTLIIGSIAVAEVVTLAYLERRAHLGTLRALGWARGDIMQLLVGHAIGLGIAGGGIASLCVIAAGIALGTSIQAVLAALAAALTMAFVATAIAAAAPLAHAYHANVSETLHDE